jgi:ATP-binding cassette subfamily B protein
LKEFKLLLPYFKKYLPWYLTGLFFLILTDGGQIVLPLMISRAIDLLSSGGPVLSEIGRVMILMVVTAGVIALGRFGWRMFINGASRRIEFEIRNSLYEKLLSLSSKFYKNMKTGDIMARFINDMEAIRMGTGMALVSFIDGTLMTLAILIFLFTRYRFIAGYTIWPIPAVFVMVLAGGRLLGPRYRAVQQNYSRISDEAQETFSGIRVIKAFVREKYFLFRFGEANKAYQAANLELVKVWGFLFPGINFFAGLTGFLLLLMGGGQVILGRLSPGDFVAVMSYLGMLIWPMMGAAWTITILNRAGVALGRINRIMEEPPDIFNLALPDGGHSGEGAAPQKPPCLEVRNLSYAYPDGRNPILNDISFILESGQTLGILGSTGAGKTTLLKLFCRLLEPPPGTLLFKGRDIRLWDLTVLRRSLAMAPQLSFLFSAPIRENITFGLDEQDYPGEDGLKALIDLAALDRDLAILPAGLDTEVGERGLTLSGGQKQRVAIARAAALDPEVLILDDPFSAVDAETEERILNNVLLTRRNRSRGPGTNIIVSHRVSTLMRADLALVLDSGKIAEWGEPRRLLEQNGIFKRVYDLQQQAQRGN